MNSSSLSDAFDQLTVSDDQIDILLAEVQVICFLWLSILLLVIASNCNYFVLNTTHLRRCDYFFNTTHLERLSSLLRTLLQLQNLFKFDQVENLEKDYGSAASNVDKTNDIKDGVICGDEMKKIIADLFMDNVRLRKQTNRVTRHALKLDMTASVDSPSMENVTNIQKYI